MTDRELLALMAASLYDDSCSDADKEIKRNVETARSILTEIDKSTPAKAEISDERLACELVDAFSRPGATWSAVARRAKELLQ